MALEKFIDIQTANVEKIVWLTAVFYGTTLAVGWTANKIRGNIKIIHALLMTGVVLVSSCLAVDIMPYYATYGFIAVISFSGLILVPASSVLLVSGISENEKARVLSWFSLAKGCVGIVSLFISAYVLTSTSMVITYLWISAGLVVVSLLAVFICSHYGSQNETPSTQQSNVVLASLSFSPLLVFSLFVVHQIVYKAVDPVSQGYLREILLIPGIENFYTVLGWYFTGGVIISFFIPLISKKFSLLSLYGWSFLCCMVYLGLMQLQYNLVAVMVGMTIIGMTTSVVNTVTSIRIHQTYTGEMLARHMNTFQVLSAAGPFVALCLVGRAVTVYTVLNVSLVAAVVSAIGSISCLFFKADLRNVWTN